MVAWWPTLSSQSKSFHWERLKGSGLSSLLLLTLKNLSCFAPLQSSHWYGTVPAWKYLKFRPKKILYEECWFSSDLTPSIIFVFCSQWQEFQVVITNDVATCGEVLPGLLVTTKGQSLHAQIGWWFGELFIFDDCCCLLHNLCSASTIWTLTCWTLALEQQNPATTCSVAAQQYLLSIYLYYLHLGFGLPGQCQLLVAFWLLWEIKVRPVGPGVSCEVAGEFCPSLTLWSLSRPKPKLKVFMYWKL